MNSEEEVEFGDFQIAKNPNFFRAFLLAFRGGGAKKSRARVEGRDHRRQSFPPPEKMRNFFRFRSKKE
jgi:hypothetical protein